jgi:hypothetical protein
LRWTAPISLRAFGKMASSQERALRTIESHSRRWPPADREALKDQRATVLAASLVGAFAQGPAGAVQEAKLLTGEWGFEPEDIRCRRLFWWHGIRDAHVPIAIARATWSRLDGCVTTAYPGDGHISLLVNHGDEIVRCLTEPA